MVLKIVFLKMQVLFYHLNFHKIIQIIHLMLNLLQKYFIQIYVRFNFFFFNFIYLFLIDMDGSICLDILQQRWSASLDVSTLLVSIRSLLTDPNPASPANSEAAMLY